MFRRLLLLFVAFFIKPTLAAPFSVVEGDQKAAEKLFSSFNFERLAPRGKIKWSEGPLPLWDGRLLFSDTIQAKIFVWSPTTGQNIQTLLSDSGDAPLDDGIDRAEPGANGLAIFDKTNIVVCQHGARRVTRIDLLSKKRNDLAVVAPNGRRFNGPNDLWVSPDRKSVYFTDPVYAFLRTGEWFQDLPYLDELVRTNGTGTTAVYRVNLHNKKCGIAASEGDTPSSETTVEEKCTPGSEAINVEIVTDSLSRPNGIGGDPKIPGRIWVSDCCQGTHNPSCRQGTSRWVALEDRSRSGFDRMTSNASSSSWKIVATIEDVKPTFKSGCADGFAFHEPTGWMVSSCAGGLCIVDTAKEKVIARLRSTSDDVADGTLVFSNVAFGRDTAFFTGKGGVWRLPLNRARGSYGGEL